MNRISFTVNGLKCYVGSEISSDVTLVDYLRNFLELRGTKYMCREGGCGACIVSVVKTPGEKAMAVNSCLVSVTSCCGWEITTIEKVGNKRDGYHPIQKAFADNNATQCGYCTPGWIMALYSLLQEKKNLTMLEIEKSFGSNICRCTGYRPILKALKKFAKDSPDPIKIPDIEDLHKCNKKCSDCTKCQHDDEWCLVELENLPNTIEILLKDGKFWYRVTTVQDIFDIFLKRGSDSYMLVAGNTGKGVRPIEEYPTVLIDISIVSELKGWQMDQNLIIGAGTTLTELMAIFQNMCTEDGFSYLKAFYDHLQMVAHIPLRNIGTVGGNLMIKHQYNGFSSDIFILLTSVGAQLTIRNRLGSRKMSMDQFLKTNMSEQIIINILLPPLCDEHKIVTYKIMPRAQNVHAIVNAVFLYKLQPPCSIVKDARIIYSGLRAPYTVAKSTQGFLLDKKLFTNETLQAALNILGAELVVVDSPPEPSAAYRKKLALGLFYKGLLSLCPAQILNPRYQLAATKLREARQLSSGQQNFETDSKVWPITKPMQKIEAPIQCSGEVRYTEDIPSYPREVFAAFVLATEPTGIIVSINASKILSHPGVIAFYTAKDIPGLNSYTPDDMELYPDNEEILSSGVVKYYNQPIGIIVAETRYLADKAAKMVDVKYKNVRKPVINLNEAKKDLKRVTVFFSHDATNKGNDVTKIINGAKTIYHQSHFCMETIVCVSAPTEDGFEVHNSTQWIDATQLMIQRALNIKANSIDVYCRRVGGGFGIKATRSVQVAIASTLVASRLNRPCRFIQSLTTNMRAMGKRFPVTNEYTLNVNSKGVIQHVDYSLYEDVGHQDNEQVYLLTVDNYNNVYNKSRWSYKGYTVTTDTAKNTWCRSPGTAESVAMSEFMMERIACELSLDPIDVRMSNLDKEKYNDIIEMFETLKFKSDYSSRKDAVKSFNIENKWRKRGLKASFMRFKPAGGKNLCVILSVNHGDGTASITHSGIEMGQGINTKAVQIAAYFLNIPVEKIKIKGNSSFIGPNATLTAGSNTSYNVGLGVQRACIEMVKRLEPVRIQNPNASWEEIVAKAYDSSINLQTQGYVGIPDAELQEHNAFGVCFAEVEIDVLTGESEVLRIDLIEDVGRSINPKIDVGQIEGAFIMGLGYWTVENVVISPKNGEVLTDRTWSYYVPQARDIPRDFRIHFRKNSYSVDKILGTKVISEPPFCMSVAVPLAIHEAMTSARCEVGIPKNKWITHDGPYTSESICISCSANIEDFKFY